MEDSIIEMLRAKFEKSYEKRINNAACEIWEEASKIAEKYNLESYYVIEYMHRSFPPTGYTDSPEDRYIARRMDQVINNLLKD